MDAPGKTDVSSSNVGCPELTCSVSSCVEYALTFFLSLSNMVSYWRARNRGGLSTGVCKTTKRLVTRFISFRASCRPDAGMCSIISTLTTVSKILLAKGKNLASAKTRLVVPRRP